MHDVKDDERLLEIHLQITANPASATGTDQAHAPKIETAAAPAIQPARKPTTTFNVLFSRARAPSSKGRLGDSVSRSDNTALVKLPVITAVEGAPGTARRRRAN